MKSSIVMLENYFVVSLLELRPSFFQCLAQTHQLKSISIPCNDIVSLEQLVVHYTLLAPPNIEHKLGAIFGFAMDVDA